jgi:decaheme cytochrome c component MtrC/MtrF-like protein
MQKKIPGSLLLVSLLTCIMAGCGDGTGSRPVSVLAASEPCIGCHSENTSPGTGERIVSEWQISAHNTKNGAGCYDCHEPAAGHPNSCTQCHGGSAPTPNAYEVTRNPDAARKCYKCHGQGAAVHPLSTPHFPNLPAKILIAPQTLWNNMTTAAYVTTQSAGGCRNCHNPHDNRILPQHTEWAESGHADTRGLPFVKYDFKVRGSSGSATPANSVAADCVRCHTSTGYISYVTSGFTNISAWGKVPEGAPVDKTKEVLGCKTCHDDGQGNAYSYRPRKVAGITGLYNYSSKNTKRLLVNFPFPNLGMSNICMSCHTGRESGLTLAAIAALPAGGASFVNYSTQSFINSHYLTAGATIFGISGYEYPGLDYADPPYYAHKHLGVTVGSRGPVGPCVTCHQQKISAQAKASHKFRPELTSGNGANCTGCHAATAGIPIVVDSEARLESQKTGYDAALTVLASALKKRKFKFLSASPYFTNTNWQTGKSGGTTGGYGPGIKGVNTMGAAFNFNLLVHDPGGFAHNSTYTKRLLYDSIVWITTGAADPVATGNTIASIIGNTSLVPDDPALVATIDGIPISFTGATATTTRSAAISWLTNGTGLRP